MSNVFDRPRYVYFSGARLCRIFTKIKIKAIETYLLRFSTFQPHDTPVRTVRDALCCSRLGHL